MLQADLDLKCVSAPRKLLTIGEIEPKNIYEVVLKSFLGKNDDC